MTNKKNYMNYIVKTSITSIALISLIACGSNKKEGSNQLEELKTKLEKLSKEKSKLDEDIRQVQDEIAKADPTAAKLTAKLVSVDTIQLQDFTHFIELQGKVDAEGIAYVAPTGQGGVVKAIFVKPGSRVNKGQLVLKLDDAVARQSVVAAQQQIGGVKAQLAQAESIYERQQNLWKQNIGTEIQVLNAKTNVDALKSQLNAAEAQVKLYQEQANMSNVYAQISGVVDEVNIKVGEFFSPQTAATPGAGIRIVNTSELKIVTEVPDNYIASVRKGDKVEVVVAETGKPSFKSVISFVASSINPTSRSFTTEAKLPFDPLLKPNQIAVMKILDYQSKAAVAVSINVVQSDEKSKYVYVMVKEGDKMIARKKTVIVGEAYQGLIEIKSGLADGDLIITEGYQSVYDGQSISTGK